MNGTTPQRQSPVAGDPGAPQRPRRRRRKLRIALALLVLVLLALLVPPYIGLNHYRRQMVASVSASLGRTVHIQSMHLRLLPTPGIVMENFVVDEDPAFGNEPALTAPTVVATLRVSSLWRRHIEVSSISMDTPSVNLVRNPNGNWSFGSILLQAARSTNAPTTQRYAGGAPRFPYIEMSGARINFKQGLYKLPFSLFDADLALWQQSANRWRLRIHAQPVRTDLDLDLADTGTLRIDGWLGRTTNLHSLPVHLDGSWQDAQLGQATRLLFGADEGWRGQLHLSGSLRGTLSDLQARWQIHLDNPHRIEFTPDSSPSLDANCQATYHSLRHSLDGLLCLLPTAPGHLLLTGAIPDLLHPGPSLQLEVNHLPASFVAQLIGMVRQRAGSISAGGVLNGEFTYGPQPANSLTGNGQAGTATKPHTAPAPAASTSSADNHWSGQAEGSNLTLQINGIAQPVAIPHLLLTAGDASAAPPQNPHRHRRNRRRRATHPAAPGSSANLFALTLAPAAIPFGGATPLNVSGRFDASGFQLNANGEASLSNLVALHRQLGTVPDALHRIGVTGTADLDLAIQGPWVAPILDSGNGQAISTTGTLSLSHAVFHPGYLTEAASIASADVHLSSGEITWSNVAFSLGALTGHLSAAYPVECPASTPCLSQFTLELPKAAVPQLLAAFTGADAHGVLWADLLAHLDQGHRNWPHATGAVHIGTLTAGPLTLHDALANVSVKGTNLRILSLDASALGGDLHAQGSIDASGDAPAWKLALNTRNISVPQLASLFHEKWGTGHGNLQASFTAQGWDASSLASSATGQFAWTWKDGGLNTPGPLGKFSRWSVQGTLANSTLTLTAGTLQTTPGATPLPVTGTIDFARNLHLTLGSATTPASQTAPAKIATEPSASPAAAKTAGPITVTGTLAHPKTPPVSAPAKSTAAH
ncbi:MULTISPECIES: AsmA family protein [Acidobacterium]|uniref:AsmA domain-containing protein n=1 Tax=Acidobacterium capsulatum (strain ATCC 51196 / DSM 11244 / BCRC 80197 / JCM 7670 / NBRC 15755 / NCIMB 13165 / 161) TaxID=240015 RepID=C1F8Y0_ACIC5|nr:MULTISPECIES: AsmA family protein [Acidobacterium]ACO32359.1 conserved hypothetical protein [Acidobacterium capsulatum ATCC 51196]HCT59902.1 AsmA family protein [Acidobacterium sp.]